MADTLTIRTDRAMRKALEARAAAQGRSLSEVARDILRDGLEPKPLGQRTAHLRGQLRLPRTAGPWRQTLRERNWRP